MKTKKERILVLISVSILVSFIIITFFIFFINRNSGELISVSSEDISILEYSGTEVEAAYTVDQSEKIIIAKNSKAILPSGDIIYCTSCEFEISTSNEIEFTNGSAYLSMQGFDFIYVKDKRIGINGQSAVLINSENEEVITVFGQTYLDETLEDIIAGEKAIYLVDGFYARNAEDSDYQESSIRSLIYFMYDIGELPLELLDYSPSADLL